MQKYLFFVNDFYILLKKIKKLSVLTFHSQKALSYQSVVLKIVNCLSSHSSHNISHSFALTLQIAFMSRTYLTLLISVVLVFGTSCETPISLTIPGHTNPLIIEGWIENGKPAQVVVSRSLSYYSEIDLNKIMSSIDTTAIVSVSDEQGNSEQLQLGLSIDHLFGVMGKVYVGRNIRGKAGERYFLRVETYGKIYTAETVIPATPVLLDSIYLNIKKPEDTAALIRVFFHDKAEEFNCYRFFTQIKGLDLCFSQVSIGTFDDLTFNGLSLNFELLRMPVSNMMIANMSQAEYDDYYRASFRKGDLIYVKSTSIDEKTKTYWSSLQAEISAGQNPFITPGTHPSNIEGENVSGIWSGYHARYDTLFFK